MRRGFCIAAGLLLGLLPLSLCRSARADIPFTFQADTSTLSGGGTYTLDIQFTDGSGLNDGNNTFQLSGFHFGAGGSASGSPVLLGGASGDVVTGATLTDSDFDNEFLQDFLAGDTLQFSGQFTANVDAGGVPDEFSVAILDGSGNELPTTGPRNALMLIDLDSAAPTVQQFALASAAPTPEPSAPLALTVAVGITILGALRARNRSRKARQTAQTRVETPGHAAPGRVKQFASGVALLLALTGVGCAPDARAGKRQGGEGGASMQTIADAGVPQDAGVPLLRGFWINAGPVTRSADGSHTGGVFVKDVAVDVPAHTIYVAAIATGDFSPQGGVFASSDGGKTWQRLYGRNCAQIVPTGTARLYALENSGSQIIVSDDRGETWRKCARPVYYGSGYHVDADIQCIAASPAAPDVLYAGADGLHGAGVYKSRDGGRSWAAPTRQAVYRARPGAESLNCREMACQEIVVDPANADIVMARFDVFHLQSSDGGVHFYGCLGYGEGAGPSQRDVLPVKVVRAGSMQIDPARPNLGYIRTRTGFYRTGDGGRSWTPLSIPGVPFVQTIATRPGQPQIIYAATERGIYVSSDAGRTWRAQQSADAPKTGGGFTIPSVFNGTAFPSVATVVREDEPVLIEPLSGHLLYGTAGGMRILIGTR